MTEVRALRNELAAAIGSGAGQKQEMNHHPTADELLAYSSGDLVDQASESIEEHLTHCRSCLDLVLDMGAFLRPESKVEGVTELHTARAWRDFRSRLPGSRSRLRAFAMAASVLLVLGLSAVVIYQQRVADQLGVELALLEVPQPDAPIIDLFPRTSVRGSSGEVPGLIPEGSGFVILVLNLPGGVPYERFSADFVSSGGDVLWSGPLRVSEYGTFRLGVPRKWLGSGGGEIRLFGVVVDEGRQLLEIFPLDVERPREEES